MILGSVGGRSGRRGQSSLARWPRSPCCTRCLINMRHGGRFALDLIALIGRTHLQHAHAHTQTHTHIHTHTHTLMVIAVSAVQRLLQMYCCCDVLSSECGTLHHSVQLCVSHPAPTHSYAYSVNTDARAHTYTHTHTHTLALARTNRQFGVGRSLKVILL